MEELRDKLGSYKYNFFKNLQNYLDTELLFYGSINRFDYFQNMSDVDMAVITDNPSNLLARIKNFFDKDKMTISKTCQHLKEVSNTLIKGHKIKYEDAENNISCDIFIYDEKYKDLVLKHINNQNNYPLYMIILLYILKTIYYRLSLISNEMFVYLKNKLIDIYNNKTIFINENNKTRSIFVNNNITQ
jgi:predicted nucleotidyltransferase